MKVHSNSAEIENSELFGLAETHLRLFPEAEFMVHKDSIQALQDMQQAAAMDGISIQIASAYRGFERQMLIWNAKARGERDCLDDEGNCIDIEELSPLEVVTAIMRFSALPGASRHHWGSDLDVYDSAALPDGYQLQLLASEYREGGPFHALHLWLRERGEEFGFARPYQLDRGGIAPEPWHISHQPVSQRYAEALTLEKITVILESAEFELKRTILDNLEYLFERYIQIT